MSSIRWDDRSPSNPGAPRLPIAVWSPPPGTVDFIRFLGPWRGLWLHFQAERSHPCTDPDCRLCEQSVPARWMGYAPALLWRPSEKSWQPIVCPVTPGVADVLRDHVLPGLIVELRRPGRRRNGVIEARVVDRPVKDPLPPPFDVVPILQRMWRLYAGPSRHRSAGGDGKAQPDILPFRRPAAGELPPAGEA